MQSVLQKIVSLWGSLQRAYRGNRETEMSDEKPSDFEGLKGGPIAVDRKASRASTTEPAFIAKPADAPVYHGFQVLEDVIVEGFMFGKITDFEAEPSQEGDAFIVAPDNTRAGLVWEVTDRVSVSQVISPEANRWGVWAVSFPFPMNCRQNAQRNLELILPILKEKWSEWRAMFPNTDNHA